MSLGSLVVSLAANTAQFTSDMGKAAHLAAQDMEKMTRDARRAGAAIGAMFAAGTATAAVLVKQQIDAADAMDDLAQKTGGSVRALTELAHAAAIEGININTLSASMARLTKSASDTARGTGEALEAFKALGIEVLDANGNLKSSDVLMAEVAGQFGDMADGANETALAIAIFGRAGADMIPLLNYGTEGLANMRQEAHDLGLVLDKETAAAAAHFNDNLTRLNAVKKGFANQIMEAVLPSLGKLTDQMVSSARETNAFADTAQVVVTGMRMVVTGAIAAAATVRVLGDSLGKLAALSAAMMPSEESIKKRASPLMVLKDTFTGAGLDKIRAAWSVMKEDGGDMATVIETAMKNINAVWDQTAATATRTAEETSKRDAPLIQGAKDHAAAEKGRADAIKDAAAARKQALDEELAQGERLNEMFQAEKDRQAALENSARTAAEQSVEQIRVSLLTESELEAEAHENKLQQLIDARERGILSQEEYNVYQEELAQAHADRMSEIERAGWTERQQFDAMSLRKKAQTVFGELAALTAGVAQSNRKMFELNKVAGIANAILNAYEGISLALAKYPPPLSFAMAAAQGVAAFAQVQAIQNTQFGGSGGAAPSIAGSTPAQPVSPVSSGAPGGGAEQRTIIKFSGTTNERKLIQRYTDLLNEQREDGGQLILA